MSILLTATLAAGFGWADAPVAKPAAERYAAAEPTEVPDFQKHVLPVLGKAGCNGRSCHGSFQGAGGFRLSLFGYDFAADHDALLKAQDGKEPRVDKDEPETSKMLRKATLKMPHKGGERIKEDSWEYRLLHKWVQAGAKPAAGKATFKKLEVTPTEIVFAKAGETRKLRALATWSDGTVEDVTCLCRFRSNDDSIAVISDDAVVTSKGKGDTHVVAFYDNGVEPVAALLPVSDKTGDNFPQIAASTKVDELILAKLKKLGVEPSEVCTDAEFLRRVSLDIAGTLPTPTEIEAFLKNRDPKKRNKKIDELLERPGYAAWWTTKLCDVTGQSLNQLVENYPDFSRAQFRAWYDWLHTRVKANVPYDKIVEGIVLATGRESGESYEDFAKQMAKLAADPNYNFAERAHMPFFWARRNVAKPEEKALNFAYAFLGVRMQCAECHKHPFDQWTQQDFKQFAAFFNQINFNYTPEGRKHEQEFRAKYDLDNPKKKNQRDRNAAVKEAMQKGDAPPVREVFVAKPKANPRANPKAKNRPAANAGRVITPKVLGGEEIVEQYPDPREPLMDWMRSEANPYFAKAFVNRVWANYFNVGIVDPPDDMNLANPPSNAALLDYLADGFVKSGYDMKWLHREICCSDAYQRSWKPTASNTLDTKNFSHAVIRRMPAEVAYDAIVHCTASAEEMQRLHKDTNGRAIGNPAPQGNGRRGEYAFALRIFGKPERATSCDCERMNEPTLVQSLYLRNDVEVKNLLDRKVGWLPTVALAQGQRYDTTQLPTTDGKGRNPKDAKGGKPEVPLADQIAALKTRLERLKKSGKGAAQYEAGLKQLALMEKRLQEERTAAKSVKNAGNASALIREAYLRTLSRPPTKEEAGIAKKYLDDARSPIAGLRDLMWVLVNTREFITNH